MRAMVAVLVGLCLYAGGLYGLAFGPLDLNEPAEAGIIVGPKEFCHDRNRNGRGHIDKWNARNNYYRHTNERCRTSRPKG
jgi:hypothetical protein